METTFGTRLTVAIAADQRNQEDIAEAAGLSSSAISRWKGSRVPGVDKAEALVRALGISGHWLLTGDGPMYPPSGIDGLRLQVVGRIVNGEVREDVLRLLASPPDEAVATRQARDSREIAKALFGPNDASPEPATPDEAPPPARPRRNAGTG